MGMSFWKSTVWTRLHVTGFVVKVAFDCVVVLSHIKRPRPGKRWQKINDYCVILFSVDYTFKNLEKTEGKNL